VIGAGVVGAAAGRVLHSCGLLVKWFDTDRSAASRAASRVGGAAATSLENAVDAVDAVVLASPEPHAAASAELLGSSVHVVSVSDAPDDVAELLSLDGSAAASGVSLVVGAGLAPGLSGLLARHLAEQVASVDEIHVAMHGTGGPACARQHHGALGDRSIGWHDDEWVERPGGSGRELCWFPEPIGAVDCYRAAVADPLVLHEAFPSAQRISARVSATRRDRLTARLPMLAPPRRHGDVGGIRVELRGAAADGERLTHVAGASGRAGDIAGTVAGVCAAAAATGRTAAGLHVLGADPELSRWLLAQVVTHGVTLLEFTGVPRASAW
jgi:predicted dinucleotide-binding enzyme